MAVSLRRDVNPGWYAPYLPFFKWLAIPSFVNWPVIEWPLFGKLIGTTNLNAQQWASVLVLVLVPSLVSGTAHRVMIFEHLINIGLNTNLGPFITLALG